MTVCIADLDGSQYFLPLQPNNICPNSPGKFSKVLTWLGSLMEWTNAVHLLWNVWSQQRMLTLISVIVKHFFLSVLNLQLYTAVFWCFLYIIVRSRVISTQCINHQIPTSPRVNGPVQSHLRLAWESVSLLHLGTVPYIACGTVILWVWRCSGTDDLSQGPSLLQTRDIITLSHHLHVLRPGRVGVLEFILDWI